MRFVIQRVTKADVVIEGEVAGAIDKGFMVLIGVCQKDTREIADKMIKKLLGMRIFADEQGKTNLSLHDVDGEVLVISQFTLYADCKKNRPGFTHAAPPELARELYVHFLDALRPQVKRVECGVFGADMQVSLCNDGPFTVILEG